MRFLTHAIRRPPLRPCRFGETRFRQSGRSRDIGPLRPQCLRSTRRVSATLPPTHGGEPGGLGVRFGARIIDGILISIIAVPLAFSVHGNGSILVTGLFSGLLTFIYYVAFRSDAGLDARQEAAGAERSRPPRGAQADRQGNRRSVMRSPCCRSFRLGLLALIAYIVIAVTINSSPTKQGSTTNWPGHRWSSPDAPAPG